MTAGFRNFFNTKRKQRVGATTDKYPRHNLGVDLRTQGKS